MTDEELRGLLKRLPASCREVLTFALEVCESATEAAIGLVAAGEAVTRHYETPSFDDLVRLVKSAAPPVV